MFMFARYCGVVCLLWPLCGTSLTRSQEGEADEDDGREEKASDERQTALQVWLEGACTAYIPCYPQGSDWPHCGQPMGRVEGV